MRRRINQAHPVAEPQAENVVKSHCAMSDDTRFTNRPRFLPMARPVCGVST